MPRVPVKMLKAGQLQPGSNHGEVVKHKAGDIVHVEAYLVADMVKAGRAVEVAEKADNKAEKAAKKEEGQAPGIEAMERGELIEAATNLGLDFPANIKTEKLRHLVAEATGVKLKSVKEPVPENKAEKAAPENK